MGNLTEKQQILVIFGVSVLLALLCGFFLYSDYQKVHAFEDPAETPPSPEEAGYLRQINDLEQRIKAEKAEAEELVPREEQVIVFREIVTRDAEILPSKEDVNRLATTVREFETQSNVSLFSVSKLDAPVSAQAVAAMPISLKLSGSFEEFLKFVNLFENYDRIVNTKSFAISGGEAYGEGADLYAIHNISLELETYVYAAQAGIAKPSEIADYEKRKMNPGIQKQIRQQEKAAIERYVLQPRPGRRDPLISVRRPTTVEGPAVDENREEQEGLVNELAKRLQLLKFKLEDHARLVEEGDIVRAATLMSIITKEYTALKQDVAEARDKVTIVDLRRRLADDVVAPFEAIGMDDGGGPTEITLAEVQQFHTKMQVEFEQKNFEEVRAIWAAFEAKVGDNRVAAGAQRLMADMEGLSHQAATQIEFQGLALRCSGVVVNPDPTASRAILGGMPLSVDDYVDKDKECRLVEIRSDRLLFEFKGEQIWLERIR